MKEKPTYKELERRVTILQKEVKSSHLLLDKSIDIIWKMDLKLKFTYISPSVKEFFGYTVDEWLGTRLSSHTSFAEFCKMAKLALSIIRGFNKLTDVEIFEAMFYHKDGTPIDTEIAGKVLFNKKGMPTEIIGSTRVITERKIAERQLMRKTQQLRESNASKDRFFSIVAHDLRNPFNSLIGFSDLLKEEVKSIDNERITYYASLINETLLNSYDYLNNLLEWSRLQSGKIEYLPTQFRILEIVREIVNILAIQAESKNIRLKVSIHKDVTITADKNMIKTVLINLVSNAIKYSNQGSEILIYGQQKNNSVIINVKDKGVGISKKTSENLFKVEESFSTRGTNNESGTGLGLILCKEFIDKHSGQIGVNSKPGKGSNFWIELPL